LTAWLSVLAGTSDIEKRPIAFAVLKELAKPTGLGLCISCHSVDQTAPAHLAINWRAADRSAMPRAFTKFSHGPHVLLLQLTDCTACHAINEKANTSKSYADWKPGKFVSEFRPMTKH